LKVATDFGKASASTRMDPQITWGNPPQVILRVDKASSYVQNWVDDPQNFVLSGGYRLTAADVEWLRRHEQVHFDLYALALRDFLNRI
jgi:hypothetical protein